MREFGRCVCEVRHWCWGGGLTLLFIPKVVWLGYYFQCVWMWGKIKEQAKDWISFMGWKEMKVVGRVIVYLWSVEKGYEAPSFLNMCDYSLCFVVVFGASCVHASMNKGCLFKTMVSPSISKQCYLSSLWEWWLALIGAAVNSSLFPSNKNNVVVPKHHFTEKVKPHQDSLP